MDVVCNSTPQDTLASETTFVVSDKIFHGAEPDAHKDNTTQTHIGGLTP